MNMPPLGLCARHFWLESRVKESLAACARLESCENWHEYIKHAKTFAEELLYAVTEWEKYYSKRNEP